MVQKIKKNKILLFLLALSLIVLIAYAVDYSQTITITPTLTVKFPAWQQITESFSLNFIIKQLTTLTESFNLNLLVIPLRSFVNSLTLNLIQIPTKTPIESLLMRIFLPASNLLANSINLAIVCSNCVSAVSQSATISLTGTGGNAVSLGINSLVGILLAFTIISLPALVLVGAGLGLAGLLFGLVLGVGLAYMGGLLPFWFIVLLGMLLLAILTLQFRREGTSQ